MIDASTTIVSADTHHEAQPLPPAGELELVSVTKTDDALVVRFQVDGTEADLQCAARNLETFTAFRRLVADKLGTWLRHDAERGGRRGRETWNDAVERAFREGMPDVV